MSKLVGRLLWYFRQLFPLTYRTYYVDENDCVHFTVWKMWFGRAYKIDDVIVAEPIDDLLDLLDDILLI